MNARMHQLGQQAFDLRHGTDTATIVPVGQGALRDATEASSHRYEATPRRIFRRMVAHLPVDLGAFTFVDVGSGKGAVLLYASECGFGNVLGIEAAPDLHQIADENIQRFGSGHRTAASVRSVCADAREVDLPVDPLAVYLYNPFPPPVLDSVLDRLRASLVERPRPVFVLARLAPGAEPSLRLPWLVHHATGRNWTIYTGAEIT